jgi:tetratricopeptide (TPR) repeat protein
VRTSNLPAIGCAIIFIFFVTSCDVANSHYIVGTRSIKRELREYFQALEANAPSKENRDEVAYFAASRAIAATLIAEKRHALAAAFLLEQAGEKDGFAPWYVFSAAAAYETAGDLALAVPLYERLVKTLSDMEVDGKSLHFEALTRLAANAERPERKIEYYLDIIARFPDSPGVGASQFLLAKEYEKIGAWQEALFHYSAYLPYFGASVPGYPEALDYARRLVEFNASLKDWTFENLEDLVGQIRKALSSGSARQLRKFASKAGFFAISWYQDSDIEANSKVAFDLNQFMRGNPILSSPALHPLSGPYEAFLRTWGWTGRVPVWYLYFRKIDFPADPKVHGQWEWAGIYFGERMQ